MIETVITCDKCGLTVEPIDPSFDSYIAGGGSLVVLQRGADGGLGHNKIPFGGWHFHYACVLPVVNAILATLERVEKEK